MSAVAETLKSFVLPPMPDVLRVVRQEQAKADPNISRIGDEITKDVALSAEVLRTINSPAFGLRRAIGSVPIAISMLGLKNIVNLVSAAALRASMSRMAGVSLDRFWDTANDVAQVSARVAKEFTGISTDTAYTLGLFHDCGIPLLMGLHRDYGALIRTAEKSGQLITEAELHHFGVNHAALGSHVARAWNLPAEISLAILHHHHYATAVRNTQLSDEVRTLISVLKLAEHVSHTFRGVAFQRVETHVEWESIKDNVLRDLAIGDMEFVDLRDSMVEMLGAN